MKKLFQIFFLISIPITIGISFLSVSAQTKAPLHLKKTIRGEFQLVRPFQNKAFSHSFSGVFNTGVSMNFGKKKFNAGPFYSLTQYQIFPKPFQGTIDDPHSVLTIHTGGIKFSYDKFTESGRGVWSPFISPGWSFLNYTRIKCKNHDPQDVKTSAFSLNAGINYYIMFDEWMGVGFTAGYNGINHVFHPYNICLDEWSSVFNYSEKDQQGALQNIFFGFSFYFDFAYKPEVSEE